MSIQYCTQIANICKADDTTTLQFSNYTHKVKDIYDLALKMFEWVEVKEDKKYCYNYVTVLTNPTHKQIATQLKHSRIDSICIISEPSGNNILLYKELCKTLTDHVITTDDDDVISLYRVSGSKHQAMLSRISALSIGDTATTPGSIGSKASINKYCKKHNMKVEIKGCIVTKLSGVNTHVI